jgi:SulP family sulfate permease
VLSDLPKATLGSLVVIAVLGLIDPAEFVRFWRFNRLEFWVAGITAASGLVFGLLPAVLVGVLLTLFLVLVELDRIGLTELQPTSGDRDIEAAGDNTQPVPGLLILRFDGPVYTANIRTVNRKIVAAVEERPGTAVVVLDATAVGQLSLTVVQEFADLEREVGGLGTTLWIAALPPRALHAARQLPRWSELERSGRVFPTAMAAVRAFRDRGESPEVSEDASPVAGMKSAWMGLPRRRNAPGR